MEHHIFILQNQVKPDFAGNFEQFYFDLKVITTKALTKSASVDYFTSNSTDYLSNSPTSAYKNLA
jgi:hypothetical protein